MCGAGEGLVCPGSSGARSATHFRLAFRQSLPDPAANPPGPLTPDTQPPTPTSHPPAASAWSWRVVRHRDSQALASLKLATAAALEELRPFSPSDQSPTAFRKLTAGGSMRTASSVGGSSVAGGGSGSTTPRHLAA